MRMADETDAKRDVKKASFQVREHGKKPKKKPTPERNEKLCFVITKNKSNSWADDLYACGRIADLNRVYH
jgi:hypothetical protein